jgi:hypothetical protein
MSDNTEIQYSLVVSTELTYSELRKIEIVLIRILSYMRRFTGDERIDAALMKISQLITAVRSAQMAIRALQVASGPIGWLYAAVSIAGAAFATGDFLNAQG